MAHGFFTTEQERYYALQKEQDFMNAMARGQMPSALNIVEGVVSTNVPLKFREQAAMQQAVQPRLPRKILLLLPKKGK